MDLIDFEKTWEVEYIVARVKRVAECVENGNYEAAIDYLQMIQDKAKTAEAFLKER